VTIDVARLPSRVLPAGTRLHRIHRATRGPWYFSSDGAGRFDPIYARGRGTCYLAEHALGAWVEAFRTNMTLLEDDVSARLLSTVELGDSMVVADLADRRALSAGVTVAVTSGASYDDSHDIASRLQGAVAGVRWRVRHDLAQELIGVAVSGREASSPTIT